MPFTHRVSSSDTQDTHTLSKLLRLVAVFAALALVAGSPHVLSAATQRATAAVTHGIDLANLDRTCKACDDFYRFAEGGWLARHPIPADKARVGEFGDLADRNQAVVHTILDNAVAAHAAAGTNEQKIGDFYGACMDQAAIEKEGIAPLRAQFAAIDAVHDAPSLDAEVARLHNEGVPVFFASRAGQDAKDSTKIIAQIGQGGLGLPNRDYYFEPAPRSQTIRDTYVAHVAKMLQLLGDPADRAQTEAASVMTFETALAKSQLSPSELRDPQKRYNPTTLPKLTEQAPDFAWQRYFADRNEPSVTVVNISTPDYFPALDAALTQTKLDDVKTYLRWHLVERFAQSMPKAFSDEAFAFNSGVLTGVTAQQDRWKQCARATDSALGEAVGQYYVAKKFGPQDKVRARQMVRNLEAALRDDLTTLSWMSPATRREAIVKLNAITDKIGYPDKWRPYTWTVSRASYLGDVMQSLAFETKRAYAEIGKPVDKTLWGMTPPTVNAYYNPPNNEIVFPAGILQHPFFDPRSDDAVNYGGIGAVIGHEMTHGFDDQGRQYDAQGNLRDWWTPADATAYTARASCVEKQFSSYAVGDVHENGKLVLGESIADLGGLTIAHRAFEKAYAAHPQAAKIDGFSPEQRFFLGYAQIWAENDRPEDALNRVRTDPHPAAKWRVDGPLSNLPQFASAWQCKLGDPMVRAATERCQIW